MARTGLSPSQDGVPPARTGVSPQEWTWDQRPAKELGIGYTISPTCVNGQSKNITLHHPEIAGSKNSSDIGHIETKYQYCINEKGPSEI